MKKSKSTKILQNIAARHGKTVPEIRESIAEAIEIAYSNRNENNSDFWNKWRKQPSVEQFLTSATYEVLFQLEY